MGTQSIPESKPETADRPGRPERIVDRPRIGLAMWLLLAGFLIPPSLVTLVGNLLGSIPHQRLWVILLGIPIPLMLLSLPRFYTLDAEQLTISGLFYRYRLQRKQILAVRRVGIGRALVHPGSVFCSDPGRALMIERAGRLPVVISPQEPAPFLALASSTEDDGVESGAQEPPDPGPPDLGV